MNLYHLKRSPDFPDPKTAEPSGLLAIGGDLTVPRLVRAYASGIFPWYGELDPILWWSPPERAVILPGQEHLSRRTQRALKNAGFEIRVDTRFADVIAGCARIPRPGQDSTWITEEMQHAYLELHREGYAHSFETFFEGELVGGLYGVSLGAAFFGESMFSRVEYASRAAFSALCRCAWAWGFLFVDGQLPNDNLRQLGARTMDRESFLKLLERALEVSTRKGRWCSQPESNRHVLSDSGF